MPAIIRHALIAVGVVLLQWLVFDRLAILGAKPDLVLLFVAYIGLQYGRLPGAIAGFGSGILLGVVYGTWGVHMLLKTLMGFVVGQFKSENLSPAYLTPMTAAVGALAMTLIHNGLLAVIMAIEKTIPGTNELIFSIWIGSAVLTAIVAALWISVMRGR